MLPVTKAKRKIEALKRRHAEIDALMKFVRDHPLSVDGSILHPLANRPGLRYDYAVIRPLWSKKKNRAVLRLEKYLENWYELHPEDVEDLEVSQSRIVYNDVSDMPDDKLVRRLDKIHRELIPEDFEED
jgi:hypothetical protein